MAALAVGYGAWHLWRSRNGAGRETGWNATLRGRAARRAARAAGLPVRLAAATCAGLRDQLGQQETAGELAS
jgi:hypothetical protein